MEIDIRRQGRDTGSLRATHLTDHVLAVLQHTGLQPFLDESYDAPGRYPVLNEPHQPSRTHGVEKARDVDIEPPVHSASFEPHRQRVQRIMRVAPRAAPIRKAKEVYFIDRIQDLDNR